MRKKSTLLASFAAIVGLAITPEALAWGGYHQFNDYFRPSSSPDYINPSTTRSPDYFNPSHAGANKQYSDYFNPGAGANNPFSDYFNPSALPQNGRFGANGYSPAYSDPNYSGYFRRW